MAKKQITRDDVLDMDTYRAIRASKRAEMVGVKRDRRVSVGPDATFYFESHETMWWQIHEMLYIERGGDEGLGVGVTRIGVNFIRRGHLDDFAEIHHRNAVGNMLNHGKIM